MKLNMELLTVPSVNQAKAVYATCMGVSQGNLRPIKDAVNNSFQGAGWTREHFDPIPGHELLESYWWPILYG